MKGKHEKVHLSLEFLESIANLGIYDVDVLEVQGPPLGCEMGWACHQPIPIFAQFVYIKCCVWDSLHLLQLVCFDLISMPYFVDECYVHEKLCQLCITFYVFHPPHNFMHLVHHD